MAFIAFQVHEHDDLSNDFSNKKPVVSVSSATPDKPQQAQKHRKVATTTKPNRTKHGRKLTSRQDLKNLLVMRPPPVGQSQTWRYVYRHPSVARHQFYHNQPMRKSPPQQLMAALKSRSMPLILHIRQRSSDSD